MVDIFYIIISIAVAFICYITSFNLPISLLVLVLYLAYYFLIGRKILERSREKAQHIHICYHFINAFIISMSVKESVEEAYQSGIRFSDKEFNEITKEIESMRTSDRLVYLRDYFNLAVYKMFLNVFNLYQDQGGNILTMSETVISETTRMERSLTESISQSNKYFGEFLVLWILSTGVLIFIRFSISSFYQSMLKSNIFFILLIAFFFVILFSIHMFIVRYSKICVKEDKIL